MDASFQHVPAVPPRLVQNVPRLDPQWLERFAAIQTPDIADHVGLHYTMDPGIRPLYESEQRRVVGRAVTVKAWPGDGLAVFGALSQVQDGDVLVIDARGETMVSRGGFHVLAVPRLHGLRGVVVDGAIRDTEEFREVDFPLFGRARAIHASGKRWPGQINVPVSCGGVVVQAGDLVVADRDGVVVVPRPHIDAVWAAIDRSKPPAETDEQLQAKHRERWDTFERQFLALGGVVEDWRDEASS